jgi:hypothetical protein
MFFLKSRIFMRWAIYEKTNFNFNQLPGEANSRAAWTQIRHLL